MNVKQAWTLSKQSVSSWSDDYAPSMGAALSYYTLFSIAPLLIIVIAVAGLFFGADAVRGVIFAQLQDLMGTEGAKAIQEMLSSASKPTTGAVATITSIAGLLVGATTVFNELQSDLDRIWRVPAREKTSGLWTLLRTRLLSFGMILGMAFLLAVSLVMSAALAALGKWWGGWFGSWEGLAYVVDLLVNFGLLTVIFALIYKMIPRVHVSWHDVWTGAAVTALLFTIGKFLIGLYLGKSSVTSSFGAAGSLVIMMLWVYYSAQIFLFGAEFTWVYANNYGSRKNMSQHAQQVTAEAADIPTRDGDADHAAPTPAGSYAASTVDRADEARLPQPPLDIPVSAPAAYRSAEPVVRGRTKSLLLDKRTAVGVAVTTAIVVAIAARIGAVRRVLRKIAHVRDGAPQRRLAS